MDATSFGVTILDDDAWAGPRPLIATSANRTASDDAGEERTEAAWAAVDVGWGPC